MIYRLRDWIRKRFKKEPFRTTINCLVFCAHLFVFAQILSTKSIVKSPHKQIVVKTITPKSSKALEPVAAASRPQPPKAAPKPTPKPVAEVKPEVKQETKQEVKQEIKPPAKKETPPAKTPPIADKKISKTAPKKVETPPKKETKPKPPSAPSKPAISNELLKELEESFAKIEGKREQTKDKWAPTKLTTPTKMDRFDPPSSPDLSTASQDYQSSLIQHLHDSLKLPDYGEVKVQLTLHSDGSVAKCLVLKAESDKNRKYLETNLSALKFPPPDKSLSVSSKTQHTFVLTFCNEL